MFVSADGCLKADVIKEGTDQKIRIWLWSNVDQAWIRSADVCSVEGLRRFVDLAELEEVTT